MSTIADGFSLGRAVLEVACDGCWGAVLNNLRHGWWITHHLDRSATEGAAVLVSCTADPNSNTPKPTVVAC